MTSRRSFLRRLVGVAAAAVVAPRVVEAVVEALPPAEPEMFKVYIGPDAAEAMGLDLVRPPPAPVTFAAIKRIVDDMKRSLCVEPFHRS